MNLLIKITKKDSTVLSRQFDGHVFYDTTFVDMSDRLGLTTKTAEMCKNTKEALKLRKNRKLTNEQKQAVLDSPDLTGDERVVLDIVRDDYVDIDGDVVDDVVSCFSGMQISNLEEINNFFEEAIDNFKEISRLEFIKKNY